MYRILKECLVAFVLLGLVGCSDSSGSQNEVFPKAVYEVDGEQMVCMHISVSSCGVHLSECDNGIKYACVNNVKTIGKIEEFKDEQEATEARD